MLGLSDGLRGVGIDPFKVATCAFEVGQQEDTARRGPKECIARFPLEGLVGGTITRASGMEARRTYDDQLLGCEGLGVHWRDRERKFASP